MGFPRSPTATNIKAWGGAEPVPQAWKAKDTVAEGDEHSVGLLVAFSDEDSPPGLSGVSLISFAHSRLLSLSPSATGAMRKEIVETGITKPHLFEFVSQPRTGHN